MFVGTGLRPASAGRLQLVQLYSIQNARINVMPVDYWTLLDYVRNTKG